jgi:site-specific DNA-methyltransferase (adenine-specific)
VWDDIPPVRHHKYKNRGANELSIKLLQRVLEIASEKGDLVLDPFGGGGTTFYSAELMERRWVGCEIGDCQPIIDRLRSNLFTNGKLVEAVMR